MLERLREIFRSDQIKANTAVFPDIQTEALARELCVDREGAATGKRDAPPTASGTLDSHEMAIVERVERIRRIGVDNFEDHRSAYAQTGRRSSGRACLKAGCSKSKLQSGATTTKAAFYREAVPFNPLLKHAFRHAPRGILSRGPKAKIV